ncbi:hypothetical protein [Riemerella columbipharyngis]|uniref:Uncharacterized protein n=1 Tax=Riemerella columbipharyngis TaxID=1071918 RepID=A0A1G7BIF9_9FLAO|nr:hypothetical protein [Riemerella columbipharyngis]SDE26712.1 hypothetical protein SAMN05421544_1062 [Riemerella columbipharyngis]
MAKIEYFFRVKYIEDFLRQRKEKGASFKEIYEYLEAHFEQIDRELKFCEHTFQRDKNIIREVSGLEISYDKGRNIYFIDKE